MTICAWINRILETRRRQCKFSVTWVLCPCTSTAILALWSRRSRRTKTFWADQRWCRTTSTWVCGKQIQFVWMKVSFIRVQLLALLCPISTIGLATWTFRWTKTVTLRVTRAQNFPTTSTKEMKSKQMRVFWTPIPAAACLCFIETQAKLSHQGSALWVRLRLQTPPFQAVMKNSTQSRRQCQSSAVPQLSLASSERFPKSITSHSRNLCSPSHKCRCLLSRKFLALLRRHKKKRTSRRVSLKKQIK